MKRKVQFLLNPENKYDTDDFLKKDDITGTTGEIIITNPDLAQGKNTCNIGIDPSYTSTLQPTSTFVGTNKQVTVTEAPTNTYTFSTPQDIATSSDVHFHTVQVSGGDPSFNNEVTRKKYVDDQDALKADITYVDAADALHLPLAGGTMSGDINMAGQNITNVAGMTTNSSRFDIKYEGGTLQHFVSFLDYSDVNGKYYIQAGKYADGLADKLEITGMYGVPLEELQLNSNSTICTGPVTLPVANPTASTNATHKSYVDTQDALKVSKSGDTMTGALTLPVANPTASTDATHKSYVDTQDALKVSKSGDTMTGALTLPVANPTASTDATHKSYVDTQGALKVSKSGDTMTGTLNGTSFIASNQIKAADSSSTTNPSYAFTTSNQTGLYNPSTNALGIAANGNHIATFDNAASRARMSLYCAASQPCDLWLGADNTVKFSITCRSSADASRPNRLAFYSNGGGGYCGSISYTTGAWDFENKNLSNILSLTATGVSATGYTGSVFTGPSYFGLNVSSLWKYMQIANESTTNNDIRIYHVPVDCKFVSFSASIDNVSNGGIWQFAFYKNTVFQTSEAVYSVDWYVGTTEKSILKTLGTPVTFSQGDRLTIAVTESSSASDEVIVTPTFRTNEV